MPSKLARHVATHTLSAIVGAAVFSIAILAQRNGIDDGKDNGNGNGKDNDKDKDDSYQKLQLQPRPRPLSSLSLIQSPITKWNPNPNLEIAFDARTKNPMYVLERLQVPQANESPVTNSKKKKKKKKRYQFYEHKLLARPHHRSKNAHYKQSGYDRGHLAPAADSDYTDHDNDGDHDTDGNNDNDGDDSGRSDNFRYHTFSLINASPQDPTFNRFVWLRLEEWVRNYVALLSLGRTSASDTDIDTDTDTDTDTDSGRAKAKAQAKAKAKEVYVISGPIWLPSSSIDTNNKLYQYSYYGIGTPPSLVQVPTHFFKVVFTLSERNGNGDDEGDGDSKTLYYDLNTNRGSKNTSMSTSTKANTTILDTDTNTTFSVDQFAAFVIPNESFENIDAIRLIDYVVTIKDLESVTGLTFFPQENHHHHHPSNGGGCNNRDHDQLSFDILDLVTELLWHEHAHNHEYKHDHEHNHEHEHNLELTVDNNSKNKKTTSLKTLKKKCRDFEQRNIGAVLPTHICSVMTCNEIMYLPREGRKKERERRNDI